MKIKLVIKRVPESDEVLLSPLTYVSKPIIRIRQSNLVSPRWGIVLYYKYNTYALVFIK